MEIAPKIIPRYIDLSGQGHYHNSNPKSHNIIREGIAMSLRKVAGAIALLAVFFLMGGGGNRDLRPVYTLGLRRLASLCP